MLRPEENQLITHVGPGTPLGELFRRFWLPVLLSEELPAPDCPPVRATVLGEDLVAFRDTNGKVGLLDRYCAHRRADLFFGRNEECGLRCVYHGWKYDVDGNCADMPNEPAESNFRQKVRIKSYPTQERGRVIWAYMGPKHLVPQMPELEWTRVPDSHLFVTKHFLEANYFQGMEGDMDSSHASFLHGPADLLQGVGGEGRALNLGASVQTQLRRQARDLAPKFFVKETDYGLMVGARRSDAKDTYYWRITQWLLPCYTMIPNAPGSTMQFNAWFPIDDETSWVLRVRWNPNRPLTAEEVHEFNKGGIIVIERLPGTYLPKQTKANDQLIDRALQKNYSFTGIKGISAQDKAMTEGMGPIVDRSKEHLGTSDTAMIAMRRKLLKLVRNLRNGMEPDAPHHAEAYRVRAAAVELKREVPFDEGAKEFVVARV